MQARGLNQSPSDALDARMLVVGIHGPSLFEAFASIPWRGLMTVR
jgi:hypothetical protein